jgi:hypothetical protein
LSPAKEGDEDFWDVPGLGFFSIFVWFVCLGLHLFVVASATPLGI